MRLTDQVEIHAPPATVWRTTVDIERWPEWTPTVTAVTRLDEGPLRVGSMARLQQPGMPEATWTVTELTPETRFVWATRVRGIRMVGTHELAPAPNGTRSTLHVDMQGVAAALLWPFVRWSARRALRRENAGLKAVCEGSNAPS